MPGFLRERSLRSHSAASSLVRPQSLINCLLSAHPLLIFLFVSPFCGIKFRPIFSHALSFVFTQPAFPIERAAAILSRPKVCNSSRHNLSKATMSQRGRLSSAQSPSDQRRISLWQPKLCCGERKRTMSTSLTRRSARLCMYRSFPSAKIRPDSNHRG